jgi:hypothetical protein
MTNVATCSNCKKEGTLSEIKLYYLPNSKGGTRFLCEKCHHELTKNQKAEKTCPICKHKLPGSLNRCPFCGKYFKQSDQIEKPFRCNRCGTRVARGIATCPTCGSPIKQFVLKEDLIPKETGKQAYKIVVGLIAVVIAFGILMSMYVYSTSVSPEESIFDTYNPDARFNLAFCNIIDYKGQIGMRLIFDSNSPVTIKVLDEDGRPVVEEKIQNEKKVFVTSINDHLENIIDKTHYVINVKSGSQTIFEETFWYSGSSIIINKLESKWLTIPSEIKDQLSSVTLTIKNSGDLPAYIDKASIVLDLNEGPFSFNFKSNNTYEVIMPQQTKEITVEMIYPIELFISDDHIIDINLIDIKGNILASHREKILL